MEMNFRISFLGLITITTLLALSPLVLYGQEKVHIVQKGETFYSIARSYSMKAEDLMKHNGITDSSRLREGQRLNIPVSNQAGTPAAQTAAASNPVSSPSSVTAAATTYKVVKGDTFYSIARKFSVTVDAVRKVNNFSESYVLREGNSIKIPAGAQIAAGTQVPVPSKANPIPRPVEPRETKPIALNPQLSWPVAAKELSYMTGKLSGVVITGAKTEPVKSLTRGTVLSSGLYRGFGKVAIVQVDGGFLYVYGGCESLSVKEGDKVGPGTELGKLGIDAVSNKPQLFFMVYKSNSPIDPAKAPRA